MKMDSGRLFWTLYDVHLDSGSHLSASVSPEEYRMSGHHFSALGFLRGGLGSCVGSLLRAPRLRQPLLHVSVTGGAIHFSSFEVLLWQPRLRV